MTCTPPMTKRLTRWAACWSSWARIPWGIKHTVSPVVRPARLMRLLTKVLRAALPRSQEDWLERRQSGGRASTSTAVRGPTAPGARMSSCARPVCLAQCRLGELTCCWSVRVPQKAKQVLQGAYTHTSNSVSSVWGSVGLSRLHARAVQRPVADSRRAPATRRTGPRRPPGRPRRACSPRGRRLPGPPAALTETPAGSAAPTGTLTRVGSAARRQAGRRASPPSSARRLAPPRCTRSALSQTLWPRWPARRRVRRRPARWASRWARRSPVSLRALRALRLAGQGRGQGLGRWASGVRRARLASAWTRCGRRSGPSRAGRAPRRPRARPCPRAEARMRLPRARRPRTASCTRLSPRPMRRSARAGSGRAGAPGACRAAGAAAAKGRPVAPSGGVPPCASSKDPFAAVCRSGSEHWTGQVRKSVHHCPGRGDCFDAEALHRVDPQVCRMAAARLSCICCTECAPPAA